MLRALPLFAALITLAACGAGELHFVSHEPSRDAPPPPELPPARVLDRFQISVPRGTSVLVFDFFPYQTISPFRQRLAARVSAFLDAYWSQADQYDDVRIAVVRDVEAPVIPWFQPKLDGTPRSEWPATSLQFVLAEIQLIETSFPGLRAGEREAVTPLDTLGAAAANVAPTLDAAAQPGWVHLIYLRDWDLFLTSPSQAGDSASRMGLQLDRPALSPFRYGVAYFDYVSASSSCAPLPNHQGVNLRGTLSSYRSKEFELCAFSDDDLRKAASLVHSDAASLILSRVPDFGTLAVTVDGQGVPRNEVRVNPVTNELSLTGSSSGLLKPGSWMEVGYVPLSK